MDHRMFEPGKDDFRIDLHDSRLNRKLPLEHYHDVFELAYFIRADMKIFIKNKCHDISDGDLVFIKEYEIHKMLYTADIRYVRYVISFRRKFIEDVLRSLHYNGREGKIFDTESGKVSLSLKCREDAMRYIDMMRRSHEKSISGNDPSEIPDIKLALVSLLRLYMKNFNNDAGESARQRNGAIVGDIISYIDSEYSESISLGSLEDLFHASRYHICRTFRRITGFSVIEYIQHRRIIEAKRQLKETDHSVIEISLNCGFNNIQHFYRVFKKLSAATPGRFRRNN